MVNGFDWRDLIGLADALSQTPPNGKLSSASYRAAISRAYYGAFRECYRYVWCIEKEPLVLWDCSLNLKKLNLNNEQNNLRKCAMETSGLNPKQLSDRWEKEVKSGSHSFILKLFDTGSGEKSKIYGYLKSLYWSRTEADYNPYYSIRQQAATDAVRQAREVIQLLESLNLKWPDNAKIFEGNGSQ